MEQKQGDNVEKAGGRPGVDTRRTNDASSGTSSRKKKMTGSRDSGQTTAAFTTLTYLLDTIARWRRVIIWSIVASTLISTVVAFLITPQFKSTASVFPAEEADMFGGLGSMSSLIRSFSPIGGLAGFGATPSQDKYMAILESGRVLGRVIKKFDLVNVYGITKYPIEKTTEELLDNVEFTAEPEGHIMIEVYDEDPQRAADMANFFVEELNRANSELLVQNARGNRRFIEERYLKNLDDLAAAEDSMKSFQKKYGVVAMPEQTEASIKAAAELAARLIVKEVQIGVERRTLSPDHPAVSATKIEIEELQSKISEMNDGQSTSEGELKVFVPFALIPDLGAEYLRKFREVEIQYMILQFIMPLYEQAKVEEQRQTPSVVVLDRAFPAERKARPRRLFILIGGMLIGFFGSFTYVAISDRWKEEKERDTAFFRSVSRLFNSLTSDLRSLRRRSTDGKSSKQGS